MTRRLNYLHKKMELLKLCLTLIKAYKLLNDTDMREAVKRAALRLYTVVKLLDLLQVLEDLVKLGQIDMFKSSLTMQEDR